MKKTLKIKKCEETPEFTPVEGVHMALVGDGKSMTLTRIRIEPGSILPLHSHPHEQIGTCIEGRGVMTSAGEVCDIVPGSTWTIPGGEEHKFEALDEPVLIFEVWSPPREDYRKLAE